MDAKRYQVYDRAVKTDIELFVEKNVPLQTKVDLLSQQYQTVCGAMTVIFEGKEQTLPQMGKYLLETDRSLREGPGERQPSVVLKIKIKWKKFLKACLNCATQIAHNAGFSNFTDYQFKAYHRFDYTPARL